jgi:phosphatidylserine/phosphatidylglycerophosphate/cardiolipin synthase-like enzyme
MTTWAHTGRYPSRPGNTLEVFIDGEDSFAAIYSALAAAKTYLYVTFAYVDFDFRMVPSLPIPLLDLLKARAEAGVDVRILIWDPVTKIPGTIRDPRDTVIPGINQGPGSVQARWDQPALGGLYLFGCHHQKTFVMDGQIAFVGGINSLQPYWDTHAHEPLDTRRVPFSIPRDQAAAQLKNYLPLHDLFTKIQGPCVQDVEANFVERWNGATFKHEPAIQDAVAHVPPSSAGPLELQITRPIAKGQYKTSPHGERSIREIYLAAIASAKRFIYFENQYYYDHGVTSAIEEAAERGIKVIGLMARRPDSGQLQGYFETAKEWTGNAWLSLKRRLLRQKVELYCPVISRPDPNHPGQYLFEDIYVHAKALIVDDSFFTIGSANISSFSMKFHSELNVASNDPAGALALRKLLWREHLQAPITDTDLQSPLDGFDLWRRDAASNAAALKTRTKPPSRVFPWDVDL